MNPEVSVIIPAYNAELYIAQAIESVFRQTETSLEIIVVDDASSDQTAEIVRGFLDKRLQVIVNPQNLGAGGARNCALRAAKGKWIALLDSDDWYAPERLASLLKVAYAEDADMIADNVYYIIDGAKLPWTTLLSESGQCIESTIQVDPLFFVETDIYGQQGLHLGISKPLIKRDFLVKHLIKYNENIKMGQDFWFYLKCLIHGAKFNFVPQPYYFYRSHPGSLVTKSKLERLDQFYTETKSFLQQETIKNHQLVNALEKRLIILEKSRSYYSVVAPLQRGKFLLALKEMFYHPGFFKHFVQQMPFIFSRRWRYYFYNLNFDESVSIQYCSAKSSCWLD